MEKSVFRWCFYWTSDAVKVEGRYANSNREIGKQSKAGTGNYSCVVYKYYSLCLLYHFAEYFDMIRSESGLSMVQFGVGPGGGLDLSSKNNVYIKEDGRKLEAARPHLTSAKMPEASSPPTSASPTTTSAGSGTISRPEVKHMEHVRPSFNAKLIRRGFVAS